MMVLYIQKIEYMFYVIYTKDLVMKLIYSVCLLFLLIFQTTPRVHATSMFEYATLGLHFASIASFVWGVSVIRDIADEIWSDIRFGRICQEDDLALERKVKYEKLYVTYLKSVEGRIKAAYLLKYTPDELLRLADFSDQERLLAAALKTVELDDTTSEDFAWYDSSEDADLEDNEID
jgi:hypothetical protein